MKIGFNEATALQCKGQSLMADLEACEKYGFDYIEMRSDCIKDYLKEHSLKELARWFNDHRLKPWAYNTLLFFNTSNEAEKKEIDDELNFIINVSENIDMKMINTIPAFDIGSFTIDEIKKDAVQKLAHIADKLAPHGIEISLEFCGSPNCSINQFGTAYDVVKAVNRDNVGISLDAFQFHAMSSHWEDLEKADEEKIFIFHINDIENLPAGSLEDNKRLWPGDGYCDLDRTMKILKQINFDSICTVEINRPEYYKLNHDENIRIAKEKTLAVVSRFYDL
jgi:2-keto-myo-inositol isomerase